LGLDASTRAQWQAVLDTLAPYPRDASNYLPHDPPIAQRQAVRVRRLDGGDGASTTTATTTTTTSAAELDVATDAGGIYVIERVAKPLSSYAYAQITGTQNNAAKALAGTPCTLGI
jgi:hypothetical protein